ncbi:MAG TPA: hypothetical protein VEH04_20920 [Verrucomicrobiae bacterium]|nr:hypothetical protein [Verrucomicrobiae bacterium]
MKIPFRTSRGFCSFSTILMLPLIAALSATSGCATRKQVADIVAHSNAAMLGGHVGLPDPRAGAPATWQTETARIDNFIAAHPGQPAIAAALRVRQALLFLSHGQFSLAKGTFNEVAESDLHTDRDKALKRCQQTLLWWFANSTNDTWSVRDQAASREALDALRLEQERLASSPEIRDYLAEMRAWIGLATARQATSPELARRALEDALNVYGETFGVDDFAALAAGTETLPAAASFSADIRRQIRAREVLNAARALNSRENLSAHPRADAFDQWINR